VIAIPARSIKYYADKVSFTITWIMHRVFMCCHEIHAVGGMLLIDSTFGPPPLQYPFKWGGRLVFHSGMVVSSKLDMT